MSMPRATELEFLRWFYKRYGPRDSDIREELNEEFKVCSEGKKVPLSYEVME